ncbi:MULTISPECIES: RNA-directed DNA polymerase [unclassified Mesorhizobium]|uniref:RNA-directed DNA polymerase n=1 Tax=unclassified Mesorhizobium TaxID=325217 RepID=UPI001093E144|nr:MULTISPECIES: RNA-directed DNA polymerase [unclassified Mesorhizobium]TGT87178.1 RNA-directed DNA polymerase [Mesorhizobium sp. M8A.F.Ca.ET.161.01.1.1]TGV41044.1 RNA-directed DNA polymerase [Mesorhizobium sp. M8A.F.Ca.ET.142.01.1.1]
MLDVKERNFLAAAMEIGESGENDTLPYDIDASFIRDRSPELSKICFELFKNINNKSVKQAAAFMSEITVGAERLLAPSGSHGFRITTKIHPFWNLYLNGLGLAIAEANEDSRSSRVHSYRLGRDLHNFPSFFDRSRSWRTYKEATLNEEALNNEDSVVIQTDVSSYYEHIYHHRLENLLNDLSPSGSTVAVQIDRILSKLSSGRSFGLPVGGQCARILAEVMMSPIDVSLSDAGIVWHRYVDDFTLICDSQQDAYRALSTLSHSLADYGLSLNRTKTTILSAKHYKDYIAAQLGHGEDASTALRELDLHFDPYSDASKSDYEELKKSFDDIDIQFLLDLEKQKSQPDNFVLAQIGRALKFQEPTVAAQLCATLLDVRNLDSFRASWAKIMRGVYSVRANEDFNVVFDQIDGLLDRLPAAASHLLMPETNLLHFLRAIRFRRTDVRGRFVRRIYDGSSSQAVRRACIDCWRHWGDRASFMRLRNQWQNLGPDEQRMVWLSAGNFGDDGAHARSQLRRTLAQEWRLGFESTIGPTFASCYEDWVANGS